VGGTALAEWTPQKTLKNLNLPGIRRVKETSREAALSHITQRMPDYLAQVELVRLDIDESQIDNRLLKQFGSFREDPTCRLPS